MWQKVLYLGLLALLGGILSLGDSPRLDGGKATSESGSGSSGDSRGSIDPEGFTAGDPDDSRGSIDPNGLSSGDPGDSGGGIDPDGHPRF